MPSSSPRVFLFLSVWPEPQSSAAGWRVCNWVDLFLSEGWEVVFISAAQPPSDFSFPFAKEVQCHAIPLNDPHFLKKFLALGAPPQLCWFDRFLSEEQWSWQVREVWPTVPRWVETQDLHAVREIRRLLVKAGKTEGEVLQLSALPFGKQGYESATDLLLRELASFYRSDRVWLISEVEREYLKSTWKIPAELLSYLPLFYSETEETFQKQREQSLTFEERQHCCFLGNRRHPPNADAMRWLKEVLWPEVRKELPGVELHLYGAYLLKELKALDSPKEGFRVFGSLSSEELPHVLGDRKSVV